MDYAGNYSPESSHCLRETDVQAYTTNTTVVEGLGKKALIVLFFLTHIVFCVSAAVAW